MFFQHRLTVEFSTRQNVICLSPDGYTLATGGTDDQLISIWCLQTGHLLRSWMFAPEQLLHGLSNQIESLAFSSDGKVLVSGGRLIQSWEVATGKKLRIYRGGSTGQFVAISPDNSILVSHSSGTRGKTVAWSLTRGKKLYPSIRDNHSLGHFAISPNSEVLIGGHLWAGNHKTGDTIKIIAWDLKTGKVLYELENTKSFHIIWFSISQDGRVLAGGGRHGIQLWDITSGKQIQVIDEITSIYFQAHLNYVTSLAFSPDGKHLLSSGRDGLIQIWNVATGLNVDQVSAQRWIRSLSISTDGNTLVGHAQKELSSEVWTASWI